MAGRRSCNLGQPRHDAPGPSARRFASARSAPRDDARCRFDPRRGGLTGGTTQGWPARIIHRGAVWMASETSASEPATLPWQTSTKTRPREGHTMTASRDWTESGPHNSAAVIDRRQLLLLSALGLVAGAPALGAEPKGELTYGVHVSLAPTWFDPAEATGIITPFMILYALHDAMVKPMPGKGLAPSLAESWSVSEDGLTYEFVLRDGAIFHNGDPVTAEDVSFSFDRYRGTSHELMRTRVAAVEIQDPRHIRFRLAEPWPDFLTFYATTTGAGWIVPKKHIEKVGEEALKGAGRRRPLQIRVVQAGA